MAFPTIPTAGANTALFSVTSTAGTTHTSPSLTTLDNASGDLLIALIVLYQPSATANGFSSWGGGFTEFGDSSSATNPSMAMGAAYKISDGTETGTFTVASSISGRAAMCLLSVKNWHGTTVPEIAFSGITTATAQQPPNLDPAGWAAEDTLWIAVAAGGQTSLTGSWGGITSAPASYTNYAESAISGGDAIGACQIAVAFQGVNASAQDPGAFTTDTSPEIERAATIAVRPAVVVTVDLAGIVAATATVAGAVSIGSPLVGTVAATSVVSGAITVARPLAGTVAASSAVTGALTVEASGVALAGTVAASSSVSGALTVNAPLSGTVAAAATASGLLRVGPPPQTVEITNTGSGTLDWTATKTQSWLAISPESGTAPSTLTVTIDPTGLAEDVYTDTITIESVGATNTPQTVDVTLNVTSVGQNPLAGTVAGASTVSGTLTVEKPLAGTVAASSVVSGAITVDRPLAGTVAAESTVSGSLTNTPAGETPLVGTVAAQSTVSGALTVATGLAGTVAGIGATAGNLTATAALSSAVASTSTVAGVISVARPLAGIVAGSSTVEGTLTVEAAGENQLRGVVAGSSTVTGALTVSKPLAGVIAVAGTVSGNLTSTAPLRGVITSTTSVSGALTIKYPLAGAIASSSTVAGAVVVLRPLTGTIAGQTSITATLTNIGPVTPVGRLESAESATIPESGASILNAEAATTITGSENRETVDHTPETVGGTLAVIE